MAADPTTGTPSAESVGLSLGFPVDSEIHLAEYYNVGRKLDTDMPVGESYEGKLAYGYIVVCVAGMWLRFRADRPSMNGLTVRIVRLPTMFAVTMKWQPGDPLCIRPFASLDEAMADFASRLETDHGIKKLVDDPRTPEWVRDTSLIFTVDMLRSNFEITHEFNDVEKLCDELKGVGCPSDTVIYIPGWQGAYDAAHPTYRPAEELGGEPAFRKMVEAAHRSGFKIMIHATGWGIDPYHPDIDDLVKLAKKEENGDFQGWQFGYVRRPEMIDLGFFTEQVPVGSGRAEGSRLPVTVTTSPAPANCEALFSVGGLIGSSGRIRLTCGRRTVTSPAGWFADHDEYHFPFPVW